MFDSALWGYTLNERMSGRSAIHGFKRGGGSRLAYTVGGFGVCRTFKQSGRRAGDCRLPKGDTGIDPANDTKIDPPRQRVGFERMPKRQMPHFGNRIEFRRPRVAPERACLVKGFAVCCSSTSHGATPSPALKTKSRKTNAREGRSLRALEVKAMNTLLNRFAAILARGLRFCICLRLLGREFLTIYVSLSSKDGSSPSR